ncbi:MAG: hypothetical protein WCZ72_09455 [Gemmobacter sp.]
MALDTTTTPEAATSITGCDGYITMKALLYAIATIQSLPEADREYGDMHHMCELARDMCQSDVAVRLLAPAILEVARHTGHVPDLWPNDFGDDMEEIYDLHDLALRGAVIVTIEGIEQDVANWSGEGRAA